MIYPCCQKSNGVKLLFASYKNHDISKFEIFTTHEICNPIVNLSLIMEKIEEKTQFTSLLITTNHGDLGSIFVFFFFFWLAISL